MPADDFTDRRRSRHFAIWTHRSSCRGTWRRRDCIRRSIRWHRLRPCSIRAWSARNIMRGRRGSAQNDCALHGTPENHLAARRRGAERGRPAHRGALPPPRAFSHAAASRDRAIHWNCGEIHNYRGDHQVCRTILAGEGDGWAESSFYMVGTFDDAREKESAARKTQQ